LFSCALFRLFQPSKSFAVHPPNARIQSSGVRVVRVVRGSLVTPTRSAPVTRGFGARTMPRAP
jgi:hypothetical protein